MKAFFKEVKVYDTISPQLYSRPDGSLNMDDVLRDFHKYIMRIGVDAFYKNKKPYEKTRQFLLTAWLYQFVRGGNGQLHYEVKTGLGRMDVLLQYKSDVFIIETKLNRGKLETTLSDGIVQLTRKYLATESQKHGYLLIFDVNMVVGTDCLLQVHKLEGKEVHSFIIGIGRPD